MAKKSTFLHSILIVLVSMLATQSAQAQYNEAGAIIGLVNYTGDLSAKIYPNEYQPTYGIMMRRHFSPYFSARLNVTGGVLTGSDKNNIDLGLRSRNLSFRTEFAEANVQAELNLTRFDVLDHKVSAPYLYAGVGLIYFNPQALYQGQYFDLQPLGTEGQGLPGYGKKYRRLALEFPVGIGVKWAISKRVNLGAQVGSQLTRTDYLDDVSGNYADIAVLKEKDRMASRLAYRAAEIDASQAGINPVGTQRGNNKKNDAYLMGALTISFNLSDQYGMEWNKEMRIYDEPNTDKKKKSWRLKRKKQETIKGIF